MEMTTGIGNAHVVMNCGYDSKKMEICWTFVMCAVKMKKNDGASLNRMRTNLD